MTKLIFVEEIGNLSLAELKGCGYPHEAEAERVLKTLKSLRDEEGLLGGAQRISIMPSNSKLADTGHGPPES